MKKSLKIILSVVALSALSWSTDISSWKTNYISGGDVWIQLKDKPNNVEDWVGIYPKNASNDWKNVISWRWAKNISATQYDKGDWYKFKLDDGAYEARFFLNNTFTVDDSMPFTVGNAHPPIIKKPTIGSRIIKSTPISQGKLFASSNGRGDCMSYGNACSIETAMSKLSQLNNVLFLRGGVYNIDKLLVISKYKSGRADRPIIIESYPTEKAILHGHASIAKIKAHKSPEGGIYIGTGKVDTLRHIKIRNIEITKMGGKGITLMRTKGITIEGCNIHHNYLSGIGLYRSSDNTIIDNKLHDNSDKGLIDMGGNLHFDNGGNADGIAIDYSGHSNRNIISHNSVYNNSDDGIDNIGGVDSVITYNISHNNLGLVGGKNGGHGNGIGIKACGKNAKRTKVKHNIAFANHGNGFECNENNGNDVIFKYNTAYNNGHYGFENNKDYSQTTFSMNISSNNFTANIRNGIQNNNSWDIDNNVPYINTTPNMKGFLKPKVGSEFENMGAYAK